jgi:hypothetical protein
VIEVDELVLDATYGSPKSVRQFSQEEAEQALIKRVVERISTGPVFIRAYQGTLQRALALLGEVCNFPLIASQRQFKEAQVYQEHGYSIGELLVDTSTEAYDARVEGRYVLFEGRGDPQPTNREGGYNVRLSAMYTTTDEPLMEFTESSCAIAISNHADFTGTLEYARATGAQRILTDNIRGPHGVELAILLRERLDIDALPANFDSAKSKEWGQ